MEFLDEILDNVFREISSVAEILWHKGWAERNAGNISVNVTPVLKDKMPPKAFNYEHDLGKEYPGIPGNYFLMSAAGSRMRDLAREPREYTCLIGLSPDGKAFAKISPASSAKNHEPTSELPTHLAIHQMQVHGKTGMDAIVHTHVDELIALTQIREFTSPEAINDLLWSMHPETLIFVPEGIGFVPHTVPGTEAIAAATIKQLEEHKVVIWEKHGCLAVGKSVIEAFDQIDILAKSARIFFLCRNAGYEPQGLTKTQLDEIRKTYLQ